MGGAYYIHSVLEGKNSGRQKKSIKEGLSLLGDWKWLGGSEGRKKQHQLRKSAVEPQLKKEVSSRK